MLTLDPEVPATGWLVALKASKLSIGPTRRCLHLVNVNRNASSMSDSSFLNKDPLKEVDLTYTVA